MLVLARAHGHHAATPGVSGFGNLRYHNGPVEHTNKTYAIYSTPVGGCVQTGL